MALRETFAHARDVSWENGRDANAREGYPSIHGAVLGASFVPGPRTDRRGHSG
jgi:hypothetical protein